MLALSAKPVVNRNMIDKLDSSDFKLGWEMAHKRMSEILSFILTATPSDLKRYATSPE